MNEAVLVVDDVRAVCSVVRAMLRSVGVDDVDTATTYADAITALQKRAYRLVVSDYFLDADHTASKLIEEMTARFPDVPTFVITTDPERVILAHGAKLDLMKKPFTATELWDRVGPLIARS